MNRRTDTWRNGCFGKMYDYPVYSTPQCDRNKPPPSKNGCSSKTFLQIILAAKWLVRNSCTVYPPNSSEDLCFSFCQILFLWCPLYWGYSWQLFPCIFITSFCHLLAFYYLFTESYLRLGGINGSCSIVALIAENLTGLVVHCVICMCSTQFMYCKTARNWAFTYIISTHFEK